MAADLAAFKAYFPDAPFDSLTDPSINRALVEAKMFHQASEIATLYCTAHLISLDSLDNGLTPDGGAGVVVKEKIGPRQIDYLTQAGDDERRAFLCNYTLRQTVLSS